MKKRLFMMSRAVLFAVLLVSFSLNAQERHTLIAAAHGELPAPENIKRVVSAGPVSDTLLASLIPEKLLGLSGKMFEDGYKKYFPKTVGDLPVTGRIANRASEFPMERLVALKPDVIIDLGNTNDTYISAAERVYRQTGIPYILVDGRLPDTARQLREVAALLGVDERGAVLANFAERILAEAAKRRADSGGKKIKVYYGRGVDGLETGLSGSIHSEMLDLLGAENAAAPAGEKVIGRVSLEQLMQWQPDVIVTIDRNFYATLKKGGVWRKLDAVKNKRFYLAPAGQFGWLDHPPSVNRLLGMIWMQRLLYPEAISDARFRSEIQAYYQLFYGYSLGNDELTHLLGEGWQ